MAQDLGASVRARLLNIAKAERTDFNAVLVRYALERLQRWRQAEITKYSWGPPDTTP